MPSLTSIACRRPLERGRIVRIEIVECDDAHAIPMQPLAQMEAHKSGAASDQHRRAVWQRQQRLHGPVFAHAEQLQRLNRRTEIGAHRKEDDGDDRDAAEPSGENGRHHSCSRF